MVRVCLECGKPLDEARQDKSKCSECAYKIKIRAYKNRVARGEYIACWITTDCGVYPISNQVLVTDTEEEVYILDRLEHQSWEDLFTELGVIAWRDIPKPYKEGYYQRD